MDEALRGRVIDGKYRLTRPLGEGGMGMVWVATHTALGREFAVKLLRPEFARDPQALIRFQQEAVAVGKVGSPHLVSLTDFGTTADGEPYIVMELLEGRTLEEAMRAEKPMAVPRIADIGCQILTALATVHERGIVHRDLKPANVFLMRLGDREDFVKLLDFGVAKVLGGDRISHFTRTGVLLGTPTYMSPEQVQGGRDVDHRCDLWAVGVILFRALTGRRPHEAASRGERLAAIATQDVPPLRRFRPDLGEDLEAVLGRALTREIGRRYVTALEFRAALEPFRGGAPSAYATSLAPPPPSPVRLRLAAAFAAPAPEARPTAPAVDRGATTIPAAVGRPTVPAVGSAAPAASPSAPPPGERPTVGPAQGAATRHDGAAAGAAAPEPKEFSFAPAPAGTSTAAAAGRRRRGAAAAAVAIGVVVATLVAAFAVWRAVRSEDGGATGTGATTTAAANHSPEAARNDAAADAVTPAGAAPDAAGPPRTLDPSLRERYVRTQAQITCWKYYRMYGHPKRPAWSEWNDLPEACLREHLSLREWRRVMETLAPEELLAAAEEATRLAVPCIAEASGLSAGQVQPPVPAIASEGDAAGRTPPSRPRSWPHDAGAAEDAGSGGAAEDAGSGGAAEDVAPARPAAALPSLEGPDAGSGGAPAADGSPELAPPPPAPLPFGPAAGDGEKNGQGSPPGPIRPVRRQEDGS